MKNLPKFFHLMFFLFLFFIIFSPTLYGQEKAEMKAKIDIQNFFIPSGYMGDGEYGTKYIKFEGSCEMNPHSAPMCVKIKYTFGPQRWAGIYWQNKPDNWGDKKGNNYSKKNISKISFWAKGETGDEVVEFKSGGISNSSKKYKDSYEETTGRLTLTKEWQKYEIDLEGVDLSSVIGAFCWVASKDFSNQPSVVFYIDDIYFE